MELFWSVLADVIHGVTVLMACTMFFSFSRRQNHRRGLLFCAGFVLCTVSVMIYFFNDDIWETFVYILAMLLIVFVLYAEKIHNIVIVTVWVIFAISVINIMTTIFVDIVALLICPISKSMVNLVVSLISFSFIYVLGRIYKKSTSEALKSIGAGNLVGFTILLMADFFVASAIVIGVEMYEENIRNIYLLAVAFIIIGIFIQLAAVIILLAQRNVHKEKEQILNAYLNEQKNHYEYLENREKETKKFRHDLRNHMDMITNLAQNQEYDRIGNYLEQMNMKIDTFGTVVTVHNGIVDAIISQYYVKAKQNGVDIKVEGKFPVDCTIDAYDLCTIFSNILSNAYEAAMESEDKFISLVCGYTERNIIIVIKNSCNGEPPAGGIMWKTRKTNADYHGYGLENVKDSVKKYNGIFDIEINGKMCTLKILFNHKEEQTCVEMEMSDENSNCG